jgi:hypothetical protein
MGMLSHTLGSVTHRLSARHYNAGFSSGELFSSSSDIELFNGELGERWLEDAAAGDDAAQADAQQAAQMAQMQDDNFLRGYDYDEISVMPVSCVN